MARREDISNTIWDSLEDLSNEAMLGHLWSFTNPRAGLSGAYRCPRRDLFAGRIAEAAIDPVLEELADRDLVLYRDKIVWVPDRAGNVHSRNDGVAKSMAKDLLEIEGTWAYWAFVRRYSAERAPWIAKGIAKAPGSDRYESVLRALSGEVPENFTGTTSTPSESGSTPPGSDVLRNRRDHVGAGAGVGAADGVGENSSESGLAKTPEEAMEDYLRKYPQDGSAK